jgi:hypothetical protein
MNNEENSDKKNPSHPSGKRLKGKERRDERAFMRMLLATNRSHYTLNQMVDRKARILLSGNALILSVIIGKTIADQSMEDWKFYVLIFLGITSFISIIHSMLAVVPERSHGKLDKESVMKLKANPLFFGNFKNMTKDFFEKIMMDMAGDRLKVFHTMILDLYFHGKALEQKRKYLQSSLYIFIIGLGGALFLSLILRFLGDSG